MRWLGGALLLGAIALAVATGWSTPLGAVLFQLDPALLNTAQAGIQRHVAPEVWDAAVLPVLEAPSWLVPALLGAVALALGWRRRPAPISAVVPTSSSGDRVA